MAHRLRSILRPKCGDLTLILRPGVLAPEHGRGDFHGNCHPSELRGFA